MANPEHVEILEQGVDVWNQWRDDSPEVKVDISHADLSRSNLSSADLSEANLTRADLKLANLFDTILVVANLSEANFSGTNLSFSLMGETSLLDVNLSNVKGLESLLHWGPSYIDISTLYKSEGKIPKIFPRGCGVPENLIQYMPSLVDQPVEYYSCFISYSHADKSFAQRLHDQLQGRGIRCWLDDHQMFPGDDIYEQVDRGIRLWDKVLLCCSKASLTSWWVDNEILKKKGS